MPSRSNIFSFLSGSFNALLHSQACPQGWIQDTAGVTWGGGSAGSVGHNVNKCTKCPSGKSTSGEGNYFCNACGKGQFQSTDSGNPCNVCAAGQYSDQVATSPNNDFCKTCPTGRFILSHRTNANEHDAINDCKFCLAGYSFSTSVADKCSMCTSGKYQSENTKASVDCKICPSGRFNPSTSTTDHTKYDEIEDCNSCPDDQDSSDDGTKCTVGALYEVQAVSSFTNPVEGSTFMFQVTLARSVEAGKTVTVEITSDSTSICTVQSNSGDTPVRRLTFTSKVTKNVPINMIDDDVDQGDAAKKNCKLMHEIVSSDDPNYVVSTSPIAFEHLKVDNDDRAGISLAVKQNPMLYSSQMIPFSLDEGQGDHYFVKILSKPNSNKVVTLNSAITGEDQVELVVSPTSLTFSENDWNVPQRVNITAKKNKIDNVKDVESLKITYTASSTDEVYTSYIQTMESLVVLIDVRDTETAGLVLQTGLIPDDPNVPSLFVSDVTIGKDTGENDFIQRTSDGSDLTGQPVMIDSVVGFATTPSSDVTLQAKVCSNGQDSTEVANAIKLNSLAVVKIPDELLTDSNVLHSPFQLPRQVDIKSLTYNSFQGGVNLFEILIFPVSSDPKYSLKVGEEITLCQQEAAQRSSLVKTLPFRVQAPVTDTQKGFNVAALAASPQEGETFEHKITLKNRDGTEEVTVKGTITSGDCKFIVNSEEKTETMFTFDESTTEKIFKISSLEDEIDQEYVSCVITYSEDSDSGSSEYASTVKKQLSRTMMLPAQH